MTMLFFGLLGLSFYMRDLRFTRETPLLARMGAAGRLPLRLVPPVLARHAPPAALPETMPQVMQLAAHASHFLLYVLMLAVPLSHWLMSSAKDSKTV